MPHSRLSFKKKRLRSAFHGTEDKPVYSDTLEEIEEKLVNIGMTYLLMKLPVNKITTNFEQEIKLRIEDEVFQSIIREANYKDIESIVHIYNRSWSTAHTPFSIMTEEAMTEILNYPETAILIANYKSMDVGFIILDRDGDDLEFGIIAGLGIINQFQRKGLGRLLGIHAWDYFKKKNIKELRCEVYIENKASYDFIRSLGFEEYDKRVYRMEDFLIKDTDN